MKFESKTIEQLELLSAVELSTYFEAKKKHEKEELEEKGKAGSLNSLELKGQLGSLELKYEAIKVDNLELKTKIELLDAALVEVKNQAPSSTAPKSDFTLKLEGKSAEIDELKTKRNSIVEFEFKTVTNGTDHGNITSTSDFAPIRPGVTDQVKERVLVQNLFPRVKIAQDTYRYTEQTAVRRDAKNVAYNEASAHTAGEETTETLRVVTKTLVIVKDLVDISTTFLKDFGFMQQRTNRLINESIAYKVEGDIINGDDDTASSNEMNSIHNVSSDFDAANVAAPVDSVADANLIDLILSMDMQIDVLGDENNYDADTSLIHRSDWFKSAAMLKDTTGRYLDERIQRNGRNSLIDGKIRVLTSNKVTVGNVYVFDSSKGEVIDRDAISIEIAYENGTKWEQEIATMKGYVRMQFVVEDNNANAFMRCTDIPAAITAIGTVPAP